MRVRDGIAVWVTILAFVPWVSAQENTPTQDQQPAQNTATDADKPAQPQANQDQEQNQDRKGTAENAAPEASPEAKKLDSHMAKCLNMCNHSEIELAKMALDKSQNQQVRELAQKLIDDHTSAKEDLKRFIAHNATTVSDAAAENQTKPAHADPVDHLAHKIAKNELAMTKDVLMRYEGQDFDMGFLGQQIVAHTQMLAKLHAMKDEGSQAFQLSVANMIGTAEDHFQDAVRLSRQLQNREDSPASVQGTTSERSTRRSTTAEPRTTNRPVNGQQPAADNQPKNQDRVGNPQDEK